IDREVFGGAWLRPSPFAPVLTHDGAELELGLGAAHGVAYGSTWRVFPPTSRVPEGEALGELRVEGVSATRSRARIVEQAPDGEAFVRAESDDSAAREPRDWIGYRAFETARGFGPRLRVLVAEPTALEEALVAAIDASSLLRPARDPLAADLVIHRVGPREKPFSTDPAPELHPLEIPHWVVVDRAGVQAAPARPLALQSVDRIAEGLVGDLEGLARHRFLHALEHPDPTSSLARYVDVQMLRCRRSGLWSRLEPGGLVPLYNRFGLRIERRAGAPDKLYVAALDLGLSGAVTVLYPRRSRRVAWDRGRLEIGFRADDEMYVQLPEGYPSPGEPPFCRGLETVLIFLTTRWTDFDSLTQEGVGPLRSESDSPLARILQCGLGVSLRSQGSENLLESPDAWGLVVCPFHVVR
ncbi:MAG: hypothetical protein MI919_43280, partial [Holophagales bacterium]|nr:hypothetical protein [Holophagales bacterium]